MEPKKKLLYLAVCDPDLPVTGVTLRMGVFVKQLSRFYDITLVHMAGGGHAVAPEVEERFRDRHNHLGVTQRIRVPFSQPGYFLFSPTLYQETDRLLRSGSYDYLLVDYGLAAVYGILLARRYQIPLIYCSSNVEYRMYLEMSRHDPRRLVLAPYVYWAECTVCEMANLVVVVAEKDRQEYSKWIPGDRIAVIPQGFDPDLIHPFYEAPPTSPPIVVFNGSFKDQNNVQAARQIVKDMVPKVTQVFPDVIFQFIGADPPSDLQCPNVELTGFMDEIDPYLQRANLVIAPMPYAHGISTKVVSGLAFGKTVLTTPAVAKGMPNIYPQLHAAPLEDFADKIIELLQQNPTVNTSEFTKLKQDFAWPDLLTQLYKKIEASYPPKLGSKSSKSPHFGGFRGRV
jgi:glycosyltransferase involved in cell wall biosynthesis